MNCQHPTRSYPPLAGQGMELFPKLSTTQMAVKVPFRGFRGWLRAIRFDP